MVNIGLRQLRHIVTGQGIDRVSRQPAFLSLSSYFMKN